MEDKPTITAIILSAGRGSRMMSEIPKQYMDLAGYPVLYYSLATFAKHDMIDEIILVVGAGDEAYVQTEIVDRYQLPKVKKIVSGGRERTDSVYNGLKEVHTEYVMIHDGARPCVDGQMIDRCIAGMVTYRACVAAMPVKDTIKEVDEDLFSVRTPKRSTLWQIQTPQNFATDVLRTAYSNMEHARKTGKTVVLTDDAQLVEQYAEHTKVKMIEGSYQNIKVTTPEDLLVAKIFLENLQKKLLTI